MDPATLIPTPDPIPVPWGWLQLLLLLTFFLHILLMNIMVGTTFIGFVHHFTGAGGSTACTEEISRKLPFTIAFAVNFGVAPLLFLQVLYGHFIYTSSVLMGVFWLWIIGMVIMAYYLAYVYKYRYEQMQTGRVVVTGLITVLLLVIGFIFSNNMTLMVHPESWSRYFSQPSGLLLNLADPTLVPRYLHFMFAAVAIGGLAIGLYFSFRQSKGDPDAGPWIAYGGRWFAYATMANVAIGLWFLSSLPEGLVNMGTGGGILFKVFLICGVATGIYSAVMAYAGKVRSATGPAIATLVLMILARDQLRTAYLAPWFSRSDLPVSPAYSPFILFLLFFVAGLLLVAWMLRLAFKAFDKKEVQS